MEANARFLILFPVLSCLLCHCPSVRADGGAVRLVGRQGGYQIAVFTSPTPFRAGPVDVSVLVQDGESGESVADARVTVQATPHGRPAAAVRCSATSAAATNKLFRAAVFELPEAGSWDVEVLVEGTKGSARVGFALEAAPPPPRWRAVWPWTAWPAAVVVLFCIHQVLIRRKAR